MLNLANSMAPDEYDIFTSRGFFAVRRSDKYWCGIWTDMTIEQVLMRSLKTSAGLTRGRGILPSTIAKWVHSMPAASRVIDAMETFGGVACVTSEQHVDLRESDQKRDHDIPNLIGPASPVSASVTSSRTSGQWCCSERSCQLRRCSVRWRSVHEGYGREAVQ